MKKTKERMCYPRYNKSGQLISYRFFYNYKDVFSNKSKLLTSTWKVPSNLSQKEIELERKKFELQFITDCDKKVKGIFVSNENIPFNDFADKWLEELKLREESFGSYSSAKGHLKIIKQWFGKYLLKNITPNIVQDFYNFICSRTYAKNIVTVKKSIADLVSMQNIPQYKVAENCGLNRLTLRLAGKIGQQVEMETATAVCNFFGVKIADYFFVETKQVKYAKATNNGIRTTLVMILNSAKKRMLIEHNYATKEFTNPIYGTVKEKKIFDEEDTKRFVHLVLEEKDIRKRVLFALYIYLGLRNAEVCGLEWKDIDLQSNLLSINRNSLYLKEFGVFTKPPKTVNSKRTLTIPQSLANLLQEYKEWWTDRKVQYGDLWINSDRLFLQDNGRPIHPCTPRNWLRDFEFRNGLEYIPPHALRHTSITMQIKAGVPLKTVSQRAGHSDEHITLNIYTHCLKEEDRKAADTFDRFLSY